MSKPAGEPSSEPNPNHQERSDKHESKVIEAIEGTKGERSTQRPPANQGFEGPRTTRPGDDRRPDERGSRRPARYLTAPVAEPTREVAFAQTEDMKKKSVDKAKKQKATVELKDLRPAKDPKGARLFRDNTWGRR
jgi:hypothetical protein